MTKVLHENLVSGEFTFGFELEAYIDPYEVPTDEHSYAWDEFIDVANVDYLSLYPNVGSLISEYGDNEEIADYNDEEIADYSDDEYDETDENVSIRDLYSFDDVAKIAKEKLSKIFPKDANWIVSDFKDFDIVEDGSLGYCGFEWASPIMKFTPDAISGCINFLKKLKEQDITIDSKCGFHVHISFPNMTKEDIAWIMCNIAYDKNMITFVSELDDEKEWINVEFLSDYATNDFLYKLHDALQTSDFDKINSVLDTTKYRVMRIHPQGTLEWRGPRMFIHEDKRIKPFFIKLYQFVEMIRFIMKKKSIGDYTKENFLSMLKLKYEFGKQSQSYAKALMRISENPLVLKKLTNLTPKTVYKISKTNIKDDYPGEYIIGNAVYECMVLNNISVPDIFVVASILNNSYPDDNIEEIIKKYNKPLPMDLMKRYCTQLGWEYSSMLYAVLSHMNAYSTDDLIHIIKTVDKNRSTAFILHFKDIWVKKYGKKAIPQRLINEMILSFGEDKKSLIMS